MSRPTLRPEGITTTERSEAETSRRKFLIATLSSGLATVCGPVAAQGAPDLSSLGAVLDTILPADDQSPSPSSLGVDREIQDIVLANPLLERLFGAALGWMDGLGNRPFRDLTEAQRVEILSFMQTADFNQIPGRFYHIVRAFCCELYFARAEAITGYPLNASPQPAGYPPPWS